MLNEFAYCPRLFYLEWVEGLWEENADTVEDELAHARSDRGGGRLPTADAADDADAWAGKARSVTLDAPELGLIAKIDLVEGEDGTVSPIDFKRGRPRPDGTPWEPELLQVAAQILVLRENGYRCDRGFLSFRETRTRVAVGSTRRSSGRYAAVSPSCARLRHGPNRPHPSSPARSALAAPSSASASPMS